MREPVSGFGYAVANLFDTDEFIIIEELGKVVDI